VTVLGKLPPIILLVFAADPTPLSLADVKVGEFVEYAVKPDALLRLRACERSERTLTIEVTTQRSGGAPDGTWLVDHLLVDAPLTPLSPPVELSEPDESLSTTIAGETFSECAEWRSKLVGHHVPRSSVRRCSARALVLGSGLVRQSEARFAIRPADSYERSAELVKVGTAEGRCGAAPKTKLDGSWIVTEEGKPTTLSVVAGSTWTRTSQHAGTQRDTNDRSLLTILLEGIWSLPASAPTSTTITFSGRKVSGLVAGDHTWLGPQAGASAPLEVRLQPIVGPGSRVSLPK